MKAKPKINFSKKTAIKSKTKTMWSFILFLILLVCIYIGIFHSHRYFGFDSNLWLFMIGFFSLLALEEMWIANNGKWQKLKSFLFILFVGVPIGGFVMLMHSNYVSMQLAKYGVKTTGVVTKLFLRSGRRSSTNYAVFTYKINSKIWTQVIMNEESPLYLGDTLTLICSEKDPEVFKRLPD